MHYLIQTTLEQLKAATKEVFNGLAWVHDWKEHGGGKYVAHYTEGMAVISGPKLAGNRPYFEVQCSVPELVERLSTVGNSMRPMKTELRDNAPLRAAYRVSGRSLIRNSRGGIVGVLPNFEICGRGLVGSFMAGEDVEDAEELGGLEPE